MKLRDIRITPRRNDVSNLIIRKVAVLGAGVMGAQIAAHCPGPPYGTCAWARQQLTANALATIGGPTFAGAMDLTDAIRQNTAGRAGLENLLAYLMNEASQNSALAGMLASTDDLVQVIDDDATLVPLYHVLATAALSLTGKPVADGS